MVVVRGRHSETRVGVERFAFESTSKPQGIYIPRILHWNLVWKPVNKGEHGNNTQFISGIKLQCIASPAAFKRIP